MNKSQKNPKTTHAQQKQTSNHSKKCTYEHNTKLQGKSNKSTKYHKSHNAIYAYSIYVAMKATKCNKTKTKPAPGHQKHTTKCTNKIHRQKTALRIAHNLCKNQ